MGIETDQTDRPVPLCGLAILQDFTPLAFTSHMASMIFERARAFGAQKTFVNQLHTAERADLAHHFGGRITRQLSPCSLATASKTIRRDLKIDVGRVPIMRLIDAYTLSQFRSDKPRQAFVGGIPSPSFAAYVRRRRRIRLRRLGVWGLRAFLSCETSTARRGLGERRVRSGAAPVAPEELRAESAARSLAGEGLAQRRPDHVDQFVIMARRIDEIDRMREFRGVRDPA